MGREKATQLGREKDKVWEGKKVYTVGREKAHSWEGKRTVGKGKSHIDGKGKRQTLRREKGT